MATLPERVVKRPIRRSRKAPKLVVLHGGRELSPEDGAAVLLRTSAAMRSRTQSRIDRLPDAPDRRSVANAMLMVEMRLVKAFWTIARQPIPVNAAAPRQSRRCGVDYFPDAGMDSLARFVDAAGGKWESIAPRPALPSSKAIDDANAALDWLLLIPDAGLRRLLVVGATSKRGDVGRNISWARLRPSLPQYGDMTVRTMQRRYAQALRIIVTEMTIARLSHVSHK